MIIKNNGMTPEEVQKQIDSMTKVKRGFNQSLTDLRCEGNAGGRPQKYKDKQLNEALDLHKKMVSMKSRTQKWN